MNRPTTECLVVSDKKKVSWTSGFMANDGSDGQESNANSEETESIAFANQIEWVRQSVTTYSLHLHFGSRGHWWRQAPSCNRGMEHVIEEWRSGGMDEWSTGLTVNLLWPVNPGVKVPALIAWHVLWILGHNNRFFNIITSVFKSCGPNFQSAQHTKWFYLLSCIPHFLQFKHNNNNYYYNLIQ